MTFPVLNSFSSASTLEPRPSSSLALSLTLSTDADPSTGTLCSELLVGLPETFLGRHHGLMASPYPILLSPFFSQMLLPHRVSLLHS